MSIRKQNEIKRVRNLHRIIEGGGRRGSVLFYMEPTLKSTIWVGGSKWLKLESTLVFFNLNFWIFWCKKATKHLTPKQRQYQNMF